MRLIWPSSSRSCARERMRTRCTCLVSSCRIIRHARPASSAPGSTKLELVLGQTGPCSPSDQPRRPPRYAHLTRRAGLPARRASPSTRAASAAVVAAPAPSRLVSTSTSLLWVPTRCIASHRASHRAVHCMEQCVWCIYHHSIPSCMGLNSATVACGGPAPRVYAFSLH